MGKYDTEAKIRKAMLSEIPVSDGVRLRIDETMKSIDGMEETDVKNRKTFWNTRRVIAVCMLVLVVSNGKAIYTYAKDLLVKYHLYDDERTDLNMSVNTGIVKFTEPADMEEQDPAPESSRKILGEYGLKVVPHYEKEYKDFETLSRETGVSLLNIQSLFESDVTRVTLLYYKNIARKPCSIFVDGSRLDGMVKAANLTFSTEVDEKERAEEKKFLYGSYAEKYVSDNGKLTAYLSEVEGRRCFGCYGYEDSTGNVTWAREEIYIWDESYSIYFVYDNIEYEIAGAETLEAAKQVVETLSSGL